jgi:hypothetical protein
MGRAICRSSRSVCRAAFRPYARGRTTATWAPSPAVRNAPGVELAASMPHLASRALRAARCIPARTHWSALPRPRARVFELFEHSRRADSSIRCVIIVAAGSIPVGGRSNDGKLLMALNCDAGAPHFREWEPARRVAARPRFSAAGSSSRPLAQALRARTPVDPVGGGRRRALAGSVTTATVLPVLSKNSTE